jgi:hypothetical protein
MSETPQEIVMKLRAEVEKVRSERDDWKRIAFTSDAERDTLKIELEKLRKEK